MTPSSRRPLKLSRPAAARGPGGRGSRIELPWSALINGSRRRSGDLMLGPLMKLTFDTTLLAMEAQTVIGIRLTQLAMGRGTPAETQLMFTEKMLAFVEAGLTVATGGSAQKVVGGYRKRVKANVMRLQR
jgi:hypothetical protein